MILSRRAAGSWGEVLDVVLFEFGDRVGEGVVVCPPGCLVFSLDRGAEGVAEGVSASLARQNLTTTATAL